MDAAAFRSTVDPVNALREKHPVSVADNSVDTAPKKVPGRPFPAGVSGNPSGRPKGDGLVRELILEAFQNSRAEALEKPFLQTLLQYWGPNQDVSGLQRGMA